MKYGWALLPVALCAAGAEAREARPVDLPGGRLGDAVAALGRQTGASISVDSPALWNRTVQPLRGHMGPAEALRRLLKPIGATVVAVGPGAWRVEARATRPPAPRPPVAASPPDDTDADTSPIIVTASKRETRLDAFAGSVHRIDGSDLHFGGDRGTEAILSRVATLSSTHLGSGRNKLFIRGIADSSFTGPTQATVGQYLGDLRLTYNAPDPDLRLYDIGAVEILEGPQGTLYGAGSLGGVIRLVPNAPDLANPAGAFAGGLSATWHGEMGADAGGMVNLPLVRDHMALRVVGYGVREGGYIDDVLRGRQDVNRSEVSGGRATLRIVPGDGWTVDLGGIIQNNDGRDNQYADPALPPLTRASATDGGFDARYRLGSVVVEKRWAGLSFLSSTALVTQHLGERYDATYPGGSPMLFRQENRTRFFATENRLSQRESHGFGWVVGASYIRNRSTLGRSLGPPEMPAPVTGVTNAVEETTLYAEASLRFLRALRLTGGARYSHTRLEGSGEDVLPMFAMAGSAVTSDRSEKRVLPSIALSAELLPGTTLYARYQQGFRPGGLAIEGPFVRRFRNDRIQTMETGLRHRPPGARYSLSASFAYARWQDIQADFIDESGLPSTENIGDGRIWSASAAAEWRAAHGLSLNASIAFNDSRITQPSQALTTALTADRMTGFPVAMKVAYAVADNGGGIGRIPNVAAVTARAGFDWRGPVLRGAADLRIMGWAHYVSSSRLGIGPVLGEKQGDYLDTALTARIGTERLGLSFGVTNIADAKGNRFALGTPYGAGSGRQVTPLRPRTVRVGIDKAF